MTDNRPDSYSSKDASKPGNARSTAPSYSDAGAGISSATKSSEMSVSDEIASLKETVANLVSAAGSNAVSSIRGAGESVASQVGSAASATIDAGANAANYAGAQAKSMASDLESFARRNPLGAMGGALALGVLIGMLGRGRS